MDQELVIFEDDKFSNFYPLTLSRPVYELRCGAFTLREKIASAFSEYNLSLMCRDYLAPVTTLETGCPINPLPDQTEGRTIFVNGRLRLGKKLTTTLLNSTTNQVYRQGPTVVAAVIIGPISKIDPKTFNLPTEMTLNGIGAEADIIEGEFEYYNYLWDLINYNPNEIAINFQALSSHARFAGKLKNRKMIDQSARILSDDNLIIAEDAIIGPGVVIDNRNGPVIIDERAKIGALSYIEGPCYIGPDTQIFRGNIREGCSFGPVCRVGGEVEESIFQGYSNKYHDGFMGHAYLGSWVNLGAMTTNSDLKNNYKNISVTIDGNKVDSGSPKVGSFLGDHTKTGIGTLLNTGMNIGYSCNIYGGALVTNPEIKSFSWGDGESLTTYHLDKAIEVARIAMSRRDVKFQKEHADLFKYIYNQAGHEIK